MARRQVTNLVSGAIVLVLVAATVAVVLATRDGGQDSTAPATPAPAAPVLAVKIDNIAEARPATGLGSADVAYVEPVEGGLTRVLAVFSGERPPVIGPVRSARETDYDVLAQYGKPVFSYSGAAPPVVQALHTAPLADRIVNASPAEVPAAFYRDNSRAAPHNLFVHSEQLPAGDGPAPETVFPRGAAPAGGTPATEYKVNFAAASYEFRWSAGKWLIWVDGKPFTSTESGQLTAGTVIAQKVATHPATYAEETQTVTAPVAETIGTATATVLRDGQSFAATWSRPDAAAGTTFTVDGRPLPLAEGPVWILLTP